MPRTARVFTHVSFKIDTLLIRFTFCQDSDPIERTKDIVIDANAVRVMRFQRNFQHGGCRAKMNLSSTRSQTSYKVERREAMKDNLVEWEDSSNSQNLARYLRTQWQTSELIRLQPYSVRIHAR